MRTKKIKWLVYTVLVGLIPIISRILIWAVAKNGTLDLFSASDFIAFGLVLHISNINEIEHLEFDADSDWKTVQNGVSISFIAVYSLLFGLSLLGDKIADLHSITVCAITLSIISLLLGYSVYHRLAAIELRERNIP